MANDGGFEAASELDLTRLSAAKLWLITKGDLPYLSTAVYALITVPSISVKRLSTDTHWRLYINPAWANSADVAELATELAHVLWHLLADHADRAISMSVGRGQTAEWKVACDMTIAEQLKSADLPNELPLASERGLPIGRSAEEYFASIGRLEVQPSPIPAEGDSGDGSDTQDSRDDCGSGCDGQPRPHELAARDEVGSVDRHDAEHIRKRVAIEYSDHEKQRGFMPGEWQRWVKDILDPVVPWQQVLASAVRRAIGWANGHTDYTYSRISRRQAASPRIILPATRRPLPEVAIVIDTSASMDDGLLAQALGEVNGVLTGFGVSGQETTVLATDSVVHTVGRVRAAREVKLEGGGGTDMCQGISAALALRPHPDIVLVLTDGYTDWPQVPPETVAVIACLVGRSSAELPDTPRWMQRVECVQ